MANFDTTLSENSSVKYSDNGKKKLIKLVKINHFTL